VSFFGDPGVPRAFTQSSPNQWDPNIGFTYDPIGDGKTVLRGGASYMYDTANTFTSQRNQQNPPFATQVSQSLNSYTPFTNPWSVPNVPGGGATNAGTISANPFPNSASFVGRPSAATALFPNNGQYITMPTKFHIAAYAQWTVSLQHDFPHGWQAQLQYIGSKGTHEEYGLPLDPVLWIPGTNATGSNPGCAVTIPANGTTYSTSLTAEGAAPASGANCSSTSNNTQRGMLELLGVATGQPTQGILFGGGTTSDLIDDTAYSTYEGGVLSVNHRLSSSFSVLANYTWSKCLDIEDNQGDVSGITAENPNNPRMDYGPCGFDFRNIANVSLVARSAFHFSNHLESFLLNNWEFAGLSTMKSGQNFSVTAGSDDSLTAINNDRANLVPNQPIYQKVSFRQGAGQANREYLNPAAFAAPAPTPATSPYPLYGNTSRNQFVGPPLVYFDGQISRIWQIHEGLNFLTRLEAYDLLNHPCFNTPTNNVTSSTFGQVSGTTAGPRVFQGVVKITF